MERECIKCKRTKDESEFYPKTARVARYTCRDCERVRLRNYRRQLRVDAVTLLGGKCVVCGEDDPDMLQIDHIKGGGGLEYKTIGSVKIYQKILLGAPGYQILCANHNMKKAIQRLKKWNDLL